MQRKLIDSVNEHIKKHEAPDVVAVTGDIAFSGKNQEYDDALFFFRELKTLLPPSTQFLAVPGNHDVDRDKIDDFFSIKENIIDKNLSDEFLEHKGQIKSKINAKFKNYRNFLNNLNPGLYESKEDYFWVKNIEEKNVSFLGLNSSWASEGDGDRGNIALGYPQVMTALEKSTQPNRVILLHHPIFNWFEERDAQKCRVEIFNKCGLILHGHVHQDSAIIFHSPSDSCISIGASASYTHEGFIGFQFIRVKFQEREVAARVWPYRLDTRERLFFFPDTTRWAGQKGKPYFDIETRRPAEGIKDESTAPLQIPGKYREWISTSFLQMDIKGLDPNARALSVHLPEVFIPLATANPFYKPKEESIRAGTGNVLQQEFTEKMEPGEPSSIPIAELLGRSEVILLRGNAGMGKTTLVKSLAYNIINGIGPSSLIGFLPVLIFLKDFWPIYEQELSMNKMAFTFESILSIYFQKTNSFRLDMDTITRFLSWDRAVVLVDGLDQVPDYLRDSLVDLLAAFQLQYKNNRFLITSRPHGIGDGAMTHFGRYIRDIEPLDDEKIRDFIIRWCQLAVPAGEEKAQAIALEMIEDIRMNPYVSLFTQNPLLLTAVCILYQDSKRLPERRVVLNRRIVENLIYRRYHHHEPDIGGLIEDYLKRLAFRMQERNLRSIDVGEAKNLLMQTFPQAHEKQKKKNNKIEKWFEEVEARSGLLRRTGDGDVEFSHLSFQEFMAAWYMVYSDTDIRPFLDKPWWEETLLLYIGLVGQDNKKRANQLAADLLTRSHADEDTCRRFRLMGSRALWDMEAYRREDRVVEIARQELIRILDSRASLPERFQAGEILGELGDPRIWPPPLVRVEAGEFLMGSMDNNDEKPVRHIYLDTFMIGKYPVTNREFKEFVEDGGYRNKEYWTTEGWQWASENNIHEPAYWHDRKWNGPNFPVVGVSWYEADAYARWLSEKTDDLYFLPGEAQWEKAARGPDGFIFPWGNEFDKMKCNSGIGDLYRTSPVGIFNDGESPYGCQDMAGNVGEWCADWYGEEYYRESPSKSPTGPTSGAYRVYRGGGWLAQVFHCRAMHRGALKPGTRDTTVGFRLAKAFTEKDAKPLKFPFGQKSFKKLRTQDYLYVDKTEYIYKLLKKGDLYYFISRPRRFGKSLLLSTLKELFSGNKEIFKGLWIYDKIGWEKHPVIHIDFLGFNYGNTKELRETLVYIINDNARSYGIELKEKSFDKQFDELIKGLYKQNSVVILIDEYDKPIIDHIDNSPVAIENRKILKTFYEALKRTEDYLKFVLITGVSRFSKVSIFSGLNNLTDLTVDDDFALLLGYTDEEISRYFSNELDRLAANLGRDREGIVRQVKEWYNGYSWNGADFVYNPVSIMKLLEKKYFENYWFSSGTPGFLVNYLIKKGKDIRQYDTGVKASSVLFEQFDIENINMDSLLFQTGYLTIRQRTITRSGIAEYILTYPNSEVKDSFMIHLFNGYTRDNIGEVDSFLIELKDALRNGELNRFFEILEGYFDSIPYNLIRHFKDREAYYHLVIYMIMSVIGVEIDPEAISSRGRVDAVIETPERIYVMEFKLGPSAKAVKQIEEKEYYKKYFLTTKKIFLVGVGFDTKARNINDYIVKEFKRKTGVKKGKS
ncbi:MAG: AAA family ATPase [Candidatus Aminicenantes bacterium]|nr:MAG: AAA family ATPase [Candidatus Aminicenantes bacterium]